MDKAYETGLSFWSKDSKIFKILEKQKEPKPIVIDASYEEQERLCIQEEHLITPQG
jgi:hypothetical protein